MGTYGCMDFLRHRILFLKFDFTLARLRLVLTLKRLLEEGSAVAAEEARMDLRNLGWSRFLSICVRYLS